MIPTMGAVKRILTAAVPFAALVGLFASPGATVADPVEDPGQSGTVTVESGTGNEWHVPGGVVSVGFELIGGRGASKGSVPGG